MEINSEIISEISLNASIYAGKQIEAIWNALSDKSFPGIEDIDRYVNHQDYFDSLCTATFPGKQNTLYKAHDSKGRMVLMRYNGSEHDVFFERYPRISFTDPLVLIYQPKIWNSVNEPLRVLDMLLMCLKDMP